MPGLFKWMCGDEHKFGSMWATAVEDVDEEGVFVPTGNKICGNN
jgi:hypothetical protein